MRVVSFNIWEGGGDRWPAILEVIRTLDPDVLVLQECTGWDRDPARLEQAAATLRGTPHLVHSARESKGHRFHVALVTRAVAREVRPHNDARFIERAAVEAVFDDFTVIGAHLTADNENDRYVEMHWLTRVVARPTRPTLLVGDLNSLSRRDPYDDDFAARLQRAGVDKYGHPPRFDVTDALERDGWVDTFARQEAWVTAPREKDAIRYDTRLDYGFAWRLEDRVLVSRVHVPDLEASDHHPIVIDLR